MNQLIRSRVTCVAVLLVVSMAIIGCNCDLCIVLCTPSWPLVELCVGFLCPGCWPSGGPACSSATSQFCEDNPEECAASFEQIQLTAIQICEEYPEECQQAFDTWVESLDEEAME